MKETNIKWHIMETYNFYLEKGLFNDRALLKAIIEVAQMPKELLNHIQKGDKG